MTMLRPSLLLLLIFTLLTGIFYPLLTTGIGQLLFTQQSHGSLLYQDQRVIGSSLIGQSFTLPGYFWGRPSATAGSPYNPMASGGDNLAVSHPALEQAIRQRVQQLRQANPNQQGAIPVDLLTTSASGLDPDISVAAARYQALRVAASRHLPLEQVEQLITQYTDSAKPQFLGTSVVNVLLLNQALDKFHTE